MTARTDLKRIMFISAIGCLGAALSMSLPWPQVWRSCVGHRTTGLSAAACFLGVAMPVGWITYGLLMHDPFQVLTNVVTSVSGMAVLVALLTGRPSLRTRRALIGSMLGAIGVLAATGLAVARAASPAVTGPAAGEMLGAVLAVAAMLSAIPQPLSLLRDRTQDLSGLSPLRWRLGAAACACWFAYGLAKAQPAVWLSASVGLAAAVIVCVILVRRRFPAVVPVVTSRPVPVPSPAPTAVRDTSDYPTLVIPADWQRELVAA